MLRVLKEADPMTSAPEIGADAFVAASKQAPQESGETDSRNQEATPTKKNADLHSAGYDARCTGMVAAFFALAKGNTRRSGAFAGVSHSRGGGHGNASRGRGRGASASGSVSTPKDETGKQVERGGLQTRWRHSQGQQLYLSGKNYPLKLVKSQWG